MRVSEIMKLAEPQRTRFLKAAQESGQAITLVYRPRSDAPAWRAKSIPIPFGIPEQVIVFKAGVARAVVAGLASVILDRYRETANKADPDRWEPGEWIETGDGIDVEAVRPRDERHVLDEETDAATQPVGESMADLPKRPPEREEDLDLSGAPPAAPAEARQPEKPQRLSQMTRAQLVALHEREIGPVEEKAPRQSILKAIEEHRSQ